MKYKLKAFFGFFKPSNLKRQIEELGGQVSSRNVVILALALLLANFTVSYMLGLKPAYSATLLVAVGVCTPYIVVSKFKGDYEQIRFNDTVEYMEHMIYSFHKNGKIMSSLQDVYEISSPTLKGVVKKMLHCLTHDTKETHLFEKCFGIMESHYDCTRVRTLHKYLLECEYSGGESANALDLLLDDIRGWAERSLSYMKERNALRRNVLVSILLAMVTCGMAVKMIPQDYTTVVAESANMAGSANIVDSTLYQVGTLAALISCVVIYLIVLHRTSMSYLDLEMERDSDRFAKSKMDYLAKYNRSNKLKTMIITILLFAPLIGVEVYMKLTWAVSGTLVVLTFMLMRGYLLKLSAVKAVRNELNKSFPNWMRILVLYLQTDNVHVAVKKSIDSCPTLLKHEVTLFAQDLANNPVGVVPYRRFLASFKVPTLRLSINYLYALAQFGSDDMIKQLDYLVKQNMALAVNEEKLRNSDALAGINLVALLPMVVAVIKMGLDMMLYMQVFLNLMTGYM